LFFSVEARRGKFKRRLDEGEPEGRFNKKNQKPQMWKESRRESPAKRTTHSISYPLKEKREGAEKQKRPGGDQRLGCFRTGRKGTGQGTKTLRWRETLKCLREKKHGNRTPGTEKKIRLGGNNTNWTF